MDRRERFYDHEEAMRMLIESEQAGLWTALPAFVNGYDPVAMTVSVQTTIRARVRAPDGSMTFVPLPLLEDCPVHFVSGGGFTLTVPIEPGDEGLVVFSSRCIDGWWQLSGVQSPPEIRMHDLSDGFFIPGFRSQPRKLANISTTTAQLRSDDGTTYVEVQGGGVVKVVAPTGIILDTPIVTVTGVIDVENVNNLPDAFAIHGNITTDGEVTSTLSGTHTLTQHVHGGVQTGGGNTATPHA